MRTFGFIVAAMNLVCAFTPEPGLYGFYQAKTSGVLGLFILWLCIFGKRWKREN
jgi:hypothetical protein